MSYIITSVCFLLFVAIIWRWKYFSDEEIPFSWFLAAFSFKVAAALYVYTLYLTNGFSGDVYKYFIDGQQLYQFSKTDYNSFIKILTGFYADNDVRVNECLSQLNLWFNRDVIANDSRSIIRVNALISFVSFGYFTVHALCLTFLSFIGLTGIFKYLRTQINVNLQLLFAIVFMIPTVILFTSSVFKESYLMFVFGGFLYQISKLIGKKFQLKWALLASVFLYLLFFIKIYFLIAFVPAFIAFVISKNKGASATILNFLVVYLIGCSVLVASKVFIPEFNILEIIANKQHNFINYAIETGAKSRIDLPILNGSPGNFFRCMPSALWNVFLRPYLTECNSAFWYFAAIENLLFIAIVLWLFFNFKFKRENFRTTFLLLFFSVTILILTGLTTPVLGSMIRYKAPLLIFLLAAFASQSSASINLLKTKNAAG